MGLIISWIAVAFGLWLATKLIPDFEVAGDWKSYAVVAAVFGVLNFFLGWLLFVILGVASLGLGFLFGFVTRLVVSAIVLKIADSVSSRLTIRGFVPALLGALVLALAGSLADFALR